MKRSQKSFFLNMLLAVCLVFMLVAAASAAQPIVHAEGVSSLLPSPVSKHIENNAPTAAIVAKAAAKPHTDAKGGDHGQRIPIPTFIAAITSPTDFCFFLPPDPKAQTVAEAEDRAVAYCTHGGIPGTTGAKVFPPNFIVSAHYEKNDKAGWVQVTGLINPTVYGMSMKDEGGQYDIKAPVGASCHGYSSFVNLIEPSSSRFCMRCCQTETDCNVKISEWGCERIVPGVYTLGGDVTSHLMYPESIGMTAAQVDAAELAIAHAKGNPASALPAAATGSDGRDPSLGNGLDHSKSNINSNRPSSVAASAGSLVSSIRGVQWLSLVMIHSLVALDVTVL